MRKIINLIIAVFLWFKSKENRILGIKSILLTLDLADLIADFSKTKKDDLAIQHIKKNLVKSLEKYNITDKEDLSKIVEHVNNDDKTFKSLSIGLNNDEIEASLLGVNVGYNLKDKTFNFFKSFNF